MTVFTTDTTQPPYFVNADGTTTPLKCATASPPPADTATLPDGVSGTFFAPCLECGVTVETVDTVAQPHPCNPHGETVGALIARAYWNGHDRALAHMQRVGDLEAADVRRQYRVNNMPYRTLHGERMESSSPFTVPRDDDPDLPPDVNRDAWTRSLVESLQESRGGSIETRLVAETPWQPVDAQEADRA